MQVVEFLFYTPLGQTIVMWSLIILGSLVATLLIIYFWTMIKGGIPVWVLYVKGGARFGRMYRAKETDTAIEVGRARFIKPVSLAKDEKGKPITDEHGEDVIVQLNPPLTFWKRVRAARLYLVAEGVAQVLSWKQLIEGLPQTALSPEQLKNDPQVAAVVKAVDAYSGGKMGKMTLVLIVLMGLAIGFFMAWTFCATGILPVNVGLLVKGIFML